VRESYRGWRCVRLRYNHLSPYFFLLFQIFSLNKEKGREKSYNTDEMAVHEQNTVDKDNLFEV